MEKQEEIEFVYRLGIQLFKSPSGFFGRCPVCGDSKKSLSKKRFHILISNKFNHITVHCFNCSLTKSFKSFLKEFNPLLYEEYQLKEKKLFFEKIKEQKIFVKKSPFVPVEDEHQLKLFFPNKNTFKPASDFSHIVDYCRGRGIYHYIDNLYFVDKKTSKFRDLLIFPLTKNKLWYGFQGRKIDKKRFNTFCKSNFKVFNIFNVDRKKPIFITESIIDSLMVENSISILGSDVSEHILTELNGCELIFCFDNDKTGFQRSLKYLNKGFKIFLFPDTFVEKDLNELRLKNKDLDIKNLILDNVYGGFEGIIKTNFKLLKKC